MKIGGQKEIVGKCRKEWKRKKGRWALQRPFVVAGIAWGAGILLADRMGNHAALFLGLAVSFLLSGVCYDYLFRKGRPVWIFLSALFLAAAHFSWVDGQNRSQIPSTVEGEEMTVAGTIISSPVVDGDVLRFDLKLDRLQQKDRVINGNREKIRVFLSLQSKEEAEKAGQLRRYSRIRLPVRMEKPSQRSNPGGMDYRAYLFRQKIHWTGKGKGLHSLVMLKEAPPHPVGWVDAWRKKLAGQLEKLYDEPVSGYLRGLLLGERLEVDPDWERQYTRLGLVHLLSISGLHVTVLTGIVYYILKWIGLTREKAAWVVLGLLPVYAVLTGLGAPVARAAVMAGLTMVALIFRKPGDSLSFWGIALLLLLVWDPYQLFEAGFQLSFLLTAGLIVWTEPVSGQLTWLPSPLRYPVAGNLVAEWLSFPLVIDHFHEYSFMSLPANLLFAPIVSFVVLPVSLLLLGLSWIWESGSMGAANVMETGIRMMQGGMEWLSTWKAFCPAFPSPPEWWILLYYLSSAMALWSWLRRGKPVFLAASVAALSLLLWAEPGKEDVLARLAFLDVGQGDATVIETANGQTVLVDGGGHVRYDNHEAWRRRKHPFRVGEDVIVPYLKSQGIQKIDWLILTHGDQDHINGLLDVIRRFPVQKVVRNARLPANEEERQLMTELHRQKVPVYVSPVGRTLEIERGTGFAFLHPDPVRHGGKGEATNEDSVVCLFSVHGINVLFPGDIGTETEKRLLQRWRWPAVDILKVAHHGSGSSTHETWLDVLKPKHAVISAGRYNTYGHPAPEVISRLEKRGISIWRTDQQGAVIFEIGKKGMTVSSVRDATRKMFHLK
ncbi:hypothetical protein JS81_05205 [Thermoactinomyces sp. Gus2-1]|uniref:DNA internalization-related competence protein ComEC/Rec2 n=1 Tax=Thermoactinomyces vulgaris TaxID=2026 RepID=UPI0005040C4E|nr:DNA internalization-related competence protein ComEC/Rec2 [Thermoactinomyces vulgaris]KFZ40811.1 hypothetical protein JS81_05205 [Thermoactinomyces sp. Gus2-1]